MTASAPEPDGPEHILCDTTFVSLVSLAASRPAVIAHWPQEPRDRLEQAVLAISVFTLGELRSGHIRARWGQAKIDSAEKAISAYLLVPVDMDVLAAYVDIRARFLGQMSDNDMWIAATAKARNWPLVACDLDFCRLKAELDLIYLPRNADSPADCP